MNRQGDTMADEPTFNETEAPAMFDEASRMPDSDSGFLARITDQVRLQRDPRTAETDRWLLQYPTREGLASALTPELREQLNQVRLGEPGQR
jgi:hypothetical protein